MKRKMFKRLTAALLSAVMVCGTVLPSLAATNTESHTHTAFEEAMENVAPFTSTEDLIEQVKAELYAEGKFIAPDEGEVEFKAPRGANELAVWSFDGAKHYYAVYPYSGETANGYVMSGAPTEADSVYHNTTDGQLEAMDAMFEVLDTTPMAGTHVHDFSGDVKVLWKANGSEAISLTHCTDCAVVEMADVTPTVGAVLGDCQNREGNEYTAAGDTYIVYGDYGDHDIDAVAETTTVMAHYKCQTCGDLFKDAAATEPTTLADLEKADVCTHAGATLYGATQAKCEEDGLKAHYYCTACGNYVEMVANGTQLSPGAVVSYDSLVVAPATGHNMQAGTVVAPQCEQGGYTVYTCANGCGETEDRDLTPVTGHDMQAGTVVDPKCDEGGYTVYTCANNCGKTENGDLTPAAGHSTQLVAETNTVMAHYKCQTCGDLFKDAAATEPTTLAMLGQDCKHLTAVLVTDMRATCCEGGMVNHFHCTGCNSYFSVTSDGNGGYMPGVAVTLADLEEEALGHNDSNVTYVAATETQRDYFVCEEGKTFLKYNGVLTEVDEITLCKHANAVLTPWKGADCENPGNASYWTCPDCKSTLAYDTENTTTPGKILNAEEIAALVIPATGHTHGLVDATWVSIPFYFTDDGTATGNIITDENGEFYYTLPDGTKMPTMALTYDPVTKEIGYGPAVAQYYWTCAMTIGCASCGDYATYTEPDVTVTSVTYNDEYFAANPTDQANMLNYDDTVYTATYGEFTSTHNGTKAEAQMAWEQMCQFNEDFAHYFGAATPYWVSKNTESDPMGALVWLTNMQEYDLVPNNIRAYMANMLTQAFMSYVVQYGDMLDAMLEDALSSINHRMTDIQIYLMLHEWVAKYATFDMQSMVDQMSNASAGADPITLTPFGTLLADQLNLNGVGDNGGVCLGYAATYTWLVQHAFIETGKLGNNLDLSYFFGDTLEEVQSKAIVDFAQIKYLTNVEDASVADGDSGFGEGEMMFNASHFYNAVKAYNGGWQHRTDNWYFVDAAYDDINVETISQYRVETDGNISHANFMLSPVSMEDQYEGKFQFMDSLYDGKVWQRVPCMDEQGNFLGWYKTTDGTDMLTPDQAEFSEKYEGIQTFAYYQEITLADLDPNDPNDQMTMYMLQQAGQPLDEKRYDDDTFEQTWFSNVISEITYDRKSGAFYYVEGSMGSYASMKDMMGEDSSMSDFIESMSPSEMEEYANDPAYADEMRARPIGASDLPSDYGQDDDDNNGFGGMNMYEDEESIVIFHYGFGTYGKEAQNSSDEHGGFDYGMGGDDDDEYTDEDYGPFRAEVEEDAKYRELYPELSHSVQVYEGVLYFNLGTKIFTYDLSKYTAGTYEILNADGELQFPRGEIHQLKEYVDVTFGSDGRRFAGMGFTTDQTMWADRMVDGNPLPVENGTTIMYHPISALNLKNQITWTVEVDPDTGLVVSRYRSLIPSLYVSIGTNYSNSYKGVSGVAYSEEAVNYNADYYRFMDENKDDNENTNTEFMWSANVVDKMPMEDMLNDKQTKTVTYDAYCEIPAFTETRSVKYGLSDGSTKTFVEGSEAGYHNYELHHSDKTLVCTICLKPHDATIEQPTVTDSEGNETVEDYIDTHKHTELTEDDITFEWYTKEDGSLGCRAKLYCEETYCNRNSEWIEAEVTGEEGNRVATVTVVIQNVDNRGNVTETTVTFSEREAMLGDLNRDGRISLADLSILRRAVENRTTSELSLNTADTNADGRISIADVSRLRLYIETRGEVTLG